MNKNKWFLNGGRGSGRAIRLLCETYENRIADLEEENAELKEKVNILDNCDRLGDVITEAYKDQLTKAKELLERFLGLGNLWDLDCKDYFPLRKEAEQFLNEVEK